MLTENQINLLPERIYERLNKINTEYLKSIGRVLKKIGELRPSDVHRLQQMYNYGADVDRIVRDLAKASEKNAAEIYEIFDVVAKENYDYAKPFYKAKGIEHIPYDDNEKLKTYVNSMAKQTVGEYLNLTQHTAFAVFEKGGKSIAPLFEANKNKLATSLSDTYTKLVDYAVTKVQLGEDSYQSAVREIVQAMAKSGVRTVDYATGYSRRLDTAVRQNVLWGIKQCNQNVADFVGEEFGADGYEISYHSCPRLTHADMAGKQFAIGKARTINGIYYPSFSEVEHLLEEFNCLHFKFSVLLGVSQPAYSKEQLGELKANDNRTFEFEGEQYTLYEGTQLQRDVETAIRYHRELAIAAKEAGAEDLQRQVQYKINQLTNKYAELSKISGLPTKIERMQVKGFRSVKTEKIENVIDITEKGKFQKLTYSDEKEYKEYIMPKYKKQGITSYEHNILWAKDGGYIQNTTGYPDINGYMRGIKSTLDNPKCKKTMETLIKTTSNCKLDSNYIGFRKVDALYLHDVLGIKVDGYIKKHKEKNKGICTIPKNKEAAQHLVEEINKIVKNGNGSVTDKAVTSISLCENINYFTHRAIQFEIQLPKGTRGLITDNIAESEFISKPNSSIDIIGAEVYNDNRKSCIRIFAKIIQD